MCGRPGGEHACRRWKASAAARAHGDGDAPYLISVRHLVRGFSGRSFRRMEEKGRSAPEAAAAAVAEEQNVAAAIGWQTALAAARPSCSAACRPSMAAAPQHQQALGALRFRRRPRCLVGAGVWPSQLLPQSLDETPWTNTLLPRSIQLKSTRRRPLTADTPPASRLLPCLWRLYTQ